MKESEKKSQVVRDRLKERELVDAEGLQRQTLEQEGGKVKSVSLAWLKRREVIQMKFRRDGGW